ncbi:antimicrobial peptide NK-lysin-like [Rhea pennata]|uniref:antimicrobial peptide NK-lysin-like n=1 Tax=Rhea pennata TaxID=8795 RepID=UPI002E2715D9
MATAVTFALVLAAAAVLAVHAAAPAPCRKDQFCPDARDGSWDLADGTQEEQAPGKKCTLCTKILQLLKKAVGDEPEEDAVEAALAKVCKAVGKRLGPLCKRLVKKYREQIMEALENGQDPVDTCKAMRLCKG